MTPTLFDLPLRLGDAVALAEVLLNVLGSQPKPVNDEQRGRVASRASSLTFHSLRPYFASIERDPVHPAACYICVDGVDNQPLLLRIAPSTTSSSGLFPNAILIGRTHLGPREVVINAVPFGPNDRDRIQVFSEQINRAFLPRPGTAGRTLPASAPAEGQDPEEFYYAAVWSAIRAGCREGYVLRMPPRKPMRQTPDLPGT